MNKISKFFLGLIILVVVFTLGYKMGDANGYKDGYEIGYRYDCKEEIGTLYKQVKAQSKAVVFTDSALRSVIRENDSLKDKRLYQRRYNDSVAWHKLYSKDSLKYSVVARMYSDSVNAAVGGYIVNFVNPDGSLCRMCCERLPIYSSLVECSDGFDVRSRLDLMLKKNSKKKKIGK